jgi:hypothetical protein
VWPFCDNVVDSAFRIADNAYRNLPATTFPEAGK